MPEETPEHLQIQAHRLLNTIKKSNKPSPKTVSTIRKYHKQQTNPWHREEEPLNNHETPGRQTM